MKALLRIWWLVWILAPLQLCLAGDRPVTLVFGGDVVLDDNAGKMIAQGGDPFADFATYFRNADVRAVNLECVIATTGSAGEKNFTFRAHPNVIPVLKRHFDAVALANNHSGDFGREAFTEMLQLLKQGNLAQFGGGNNLAEAHAPLLLERGGVRFALLGYNEFMPRSFEADYNAAGSAWSEDEQVVDDIRKARQVYKADVVIPIMHWGWENELVANPRQRQLARTMIDAGADAILGGHPHVTQDIEIYKGKPIVYSVGNFVMKETDGDRQRRGWLLRLTINQQGIKGFDSLSTRIDLDGIPHRDLESDSPCWQRGQPSVQRCRSTD